jgi:hypothetical protein
MPIHLAGTLFVDDTNLEHLDMTKVETITETHEAMQCSIHNWGHILIATWSVEAGQMLLPSGFVLMDPGWHMAV